MLNLGDFLFTGILLGQDVNLQYWYLSDFHNEKPISASGIELEILFVLLSSAQKDCKEKPARTPKNVPYPHFLENILGYTVHLNLSQKRDIT